jgi:hypothetical protein
MDKADFLEDLLALLRDSGIHFCVIGGQGVNAYVEPLVTLHLDLAVAVNQIDQVRKLMNSRFHYQEFEHTLKVSAAGSNLQVQIQTDPRYDPFVERSTVREVLGLQLPVASLEDILQGKIWAASDPQRLGTKCRKDLLDIERILEANPDLRARVPEEILRKLS